MGPSFLSGPASDLSLQIVLKMLCFLTSNIYICMLKFVCPMLTKIKSILLLAVLSVAFILPASAQQENFKWMRSVQQQTVRDYSHGLSAYYENGLWGFISTTGTVVIEPTYEEVSDYDGSYIRVRKDGKWGVVTSSNRSVFPCHYDRGSG